MFLRKGATVYKDWGETDQPFSLLTGVCRGQVLMGETLKSQSVEPLLPVLWPSLASSGLGYCCQLFPYPLHRCTALTGDMDPAISVPWMSFPAVFCVLLFTLPCAFPVKALQLQSPPCIRYRGPHLFCFLRSHVLQAPYPYSLSPWKLSMSSTILVCSDCNNKWPWPG